MPDQISPEDEKSPRLLLYQVLLEEYRSLKQPPLDEVKVRLLEAEAAEEARKCAAIEEEGKRDEYEKLYDGKIVARLFELMREAQTRAAQAIMAKYEETYADRESFPALSDDASLRAVIVNRAFISEINGHVETRRKELEKTHKSITDKTERQRRIEAQIASEIYEEEKKRATKESNVNNQISQSSQKVISDELKEARTFGTQAMRSALCLSGGGIRSATFNLGILQGLARHDLLDRFSYLSTVSGGGFIGGWLTAWIHHEGVKKEEEQNGEEHEEQNKDGEQNPDNDKTNYEKGLKEVIRKLSQTPESPLETEPPEVTHLRSYSNYLAPKPGLLSADTWTLVSVYLRNLLLNQFVFIPVIMAAMFVPRICVALLKLQPDSQTTWIVFFIGVALAVIALGCIGLNLPSARRRNDSLGRIWALSLGPFLLSALLLTLCWKWFSIDDTRPTPWWVFVILSAVINVLGWLVYGFSRRRYKGEKQWLTLILMGIGLILIGFAGVANGILTWVGATKITYFLHPDMYPRFYTCFAVPLLLTLYNLGGTLIAGFTSRYTDDDDQEWWARAGAWIIIVIIGWLAVSVLVLYGPSLISTSLHKLFHWSESSFYSTDTLKLVTALLGAISGLIAVLGGKNARTPANAREAQQAGTSGKVLLIVTTIAAPLFMAFLLILFSLITDWILVLIHWLYRGNFFAAPTDHRNIVDLASLRLLAAALLSIGFLAALMGWLINTNKFSLHYYWRNRIIRAYLGASHRPRRPNRFTGFDTNDNVQMHSLKPRAAGTARLFHVLNLALNLVGTERLAWQDRMAESFTVSPLHSGSYWLGYRYSQKYGRQKYRGKEGISLGTAVAISGAAASPNMGYMMPSPVVRFIMTLFNVRLGFWMGNPGQAGESTHYLDSPRYSVRPIVAEAFGQTDDKSPYVYLSDGGHFENLGLYEMVLRRCRLIVVCDASTDTDYSFQSLGMAIRLIRIDFGIPIEFEDFDILKFSADASPGEARAYCAVGQVRYSCVDKLNPGEDKTDCDGLLIYIKPTLIKDEPRDVINYQHDNETFPEESIADQFFSEAQFESYRALASHIIDKLCGEDDSRNQLNLASFTKSVRTQLKKIREEAEERLSA